MIALVTAATAIELDADLPLLTAQLPEARVVVWDDPSVDWAAFDAVVVRSAWDYHLRRDEFLHWARRVTGIAPLWNPLEVIEWNTDKRYLSELADRGVPTVPTWFVRPDERLPPDLEPAADLVVKPSVGADSNGVIRSKLDAEGMIRHVGRLHRAGLEAMVQPYVSGIGERGETGLVYLGGEYSHAIRRHAELAPPPRSGTGPSGGEASPRDASEDEQAVGDRVMEALPPTAYARVDLLPGADGPVVLEVELTEPSLFLECSPDSAARAAAVFRSLVR